MFGVEVRVFRRKGREKTSLLNAERIVGHLRPHGKGGIINLVRKNPLALGNSVLTSEFLGEKMMLSISRVERSR